MAVAVLATAVTYLQETSGNSLSSGKRGFVDLSSWVAQQSHYGSMGFQMTPRHIPAPADKAWQPAGAPVRSHAFSAQRPCLVSVLGERISAKHKAPRTKSQQGNLLHLGLRGCVALAVAFAPKLRNLFRAARRHSTACTADNEACEKGGTVSLQALEARGRSRRLLKSGFWLAIYVIVGLLYGNMRGWSHTDACYFVVVTLTTVGYGDKTFRPDFADQVFGGFYVFVGVAFIGTAAGEVISELTARAERTAAPNLFRAARRHSTACTADNEACEKGGTVSLQALEARGRSRRLLRSGLWLALYVIVGLLYGNMRGWSHTDACYFVVVTLTTVGYGDKTFRPDFADQVFGGFYVFVGVAFIGTAAGEVISELTARAERTAANLRAQRGQDHPQTPSIVGVAFIGTAAGEVISELTARAERTAANLRAQGGQDHPQTQSSTGLQPSLGGSLRSGVEGRRYESQAELRKLRKSLVQTLAKLVAVVLFGTSVMAFVEGWSWHQAFFWACVTSTTVGYGDVVPTTALSKWIVMFYMALSLVFVANALGLIARLPTEQRKIRDTEKILQQFGDSLEAEELGALLDSKEIQALRPSRTCGEDQSRSSVNRLEFIIWLLIKNGKLDLVTDIGPCTHVFDSLDPDGSGVLDQHDIEF
eukprot:CAMPEP_0172792146 /NCGR_PEP_ID=MMETSP1074-20121228/208825_1 /TAXON_ID=2916 /ORGANISM="Ceratium fusus, Strain PA161109" /LENGTH=647 /DNA_ID=CAMNT_0013629211 /DNA_START=53 /DNA_END=1997 /DNA_ORIENTATION=-